MIQIKPIDTVNHTTSDYYGFVRKDIAPLLPDRADRILEVGAASGATLKWLKSIFPGAVTTGVELNEQMRPLLSQNVDRAIIGNIDDNISSLETYDLILLLDVLEHLDDPVGVLRRLGEKLNDNGTVIVSLPNVAHLSISLPLLLFREFEYQDSGILDRTHKRFFTDKSAVALLNDACLSVSKGVMIGMQGPKSKFINLISFGFLKHHLAKQYLMCGVKAPEPRKQDTVNWVCES